MTRSSRTSRVSTTLVLAPLGLALLAPAPAGAADAGTSGTTVSDDAAARGGRAAVLLVDDDGRQCPRAGWSSVQAAVAAARPGATVRLCAGVYDGAVTITKTLRLQGPGATPREAACLSGAPVQRSGAAVLTGELVLDADAVHVDGVVVDGSAGAVSTAITTTDEHSGYRITGSTVQGAALDGIELQSDGRLPTRVERNCIRDNARGGVVSELGELHRARIAHNATAGNFEAIGIAGGYPHTRVRIEHNTLRGDQVGIAVQRTHRATIRGNDVRPRAGALDGIVVGGGNSALQVLSNRVSSARWGIAFDRGGFLDDLPEATSGALVRGNTVTDSAGFGIVAWVPAAGEPGNLVDSVLQDNVVTGSGGPNIAVRVGNDRNTLRGNTADGSRTSYGITLFEAVGTVLVDNSAHGNALADARDVRRSQNTWTGTDCDTDEPAGTICGR